MILNNKQAGKVVTQPKFTRKKNYGKLKTPMQDILHELAVKPRQNNQNHIPLFKYFKHSTSLVAQHSVQTHAQQPHHQVSAVQAKHRNTLSGALTLSFWIV